MSVTVSRYLSAARIAPNENAPAGHGLEPIVKDLRRALAHELISPGPHMTAANASRAEQEAVARIRRERSAA